MKLLPPEVIEYSQIKHTRASSINLFQQPYKLDRELCIRPCKDHLPSQCNNLWSNINKENSWKWILSSDKYSAVVAAYFINTLSPWCGVAVEIATRTFRSWKPGSFKHFWAVAFDFVVPFIDKAFSFLSVILRGILRFFFFFFYERTLIVMYVHIQYEW